MIDTACRRASAETRHRHFALWTDLEPKGAVVRAYGVYRESEGTSEVK